MLETSLCAVACYHMLPKLDVRFQGLQKFLWKYLPALFASFGHKEKTNHVHKLPSPWMWLWWLCFTGCFHPMSPQPSKERLRHAVAIHKNLLMTLIYSMKMVIQWWVDWDLYSRKSRNYNILVGSSIGDSHYYDHQQKFGMCIALLLKKKTEHEQIRCKSFSHFVI